MATAPWPCPVLVKSVKTRIFSSIPKVLLTKILSCVEMGLLQAQTVSSLSSSSPKSESGNSLERLTGDLISFVSPVSYHKILFLLKQKKAQ